MKLASARPWTYNYLKLKGEKQILGWSFCPAFEGATSSIARNLVPHI